MIINGKAISETVARTFLSDEDLLPFVHLAAPLDEQNSYTTYANFVEWLFDENFATYQGAVPYCIPFGNSTIGNGELNYSPNLQFNNGIVSGLYARGDSVLIGNSSVLGEAFAVYNGDGLPLYKIKNSLSDFIPDTFAANTRHEWYYGEQAFMGVASLIDGYACALFTRKDGIHTNFLKIYQPDFEPPNNSSRTIAIGDGLVNPGSAVASESTPAAITIQYNYWATTSPELALQPFVIKANGGTPVNDKQLYFAHPSVALNDVGGLGFFDLYSYCFNGNFGDKSAPIRYVARQHQFNVNEWLPNGYGEQAMLIRQSDGLFPTLPVSADAEVALAGQLFRLYKVEACLGFYREYGFHLNWVSNPAPFTEYALQPAATELLPSMQCINLGDNSLLITLPDSATTQPTFVIEADVSLVVFLATIPLNLLNTGYVAIFKNGTTELHRQALIGSYDNVGTSEYLLAQGHIKLLTDQLFQGDVVEVKVAFAFGGVDYFYAQSFTFSITTN